MERRYSGPYQSKENDPRWTAVDEYALSHLHKPDEPYYEALEYALRNSREQGLPDIAVSPLQGKFLAMQCRLLGTKHLLEIGTLGGYSTIWLASASPDIRITTIEINEKHAAVARDAIEHAGLTDRVEVIVGAGVDVLPKLREQVSSGKRPHFDYVFIDADKPSNLTYLNMSLDMCKPRTCIIVDNVVRKGGVADAEFAKINPQVAGSRAVIEAAGKNPRLDATLMQTVGEKNYDGFLLVMLK